MNANITKMQMQFDLIITLTNVLMDNFSPCFFRENAKLNICFTKSNLQAFLLLCMLIATMILIQTVKEIEFT